MIFISAIDQPVGGVVALRVAGDVDAAGATQLYETITASRAATGSAVALDLSRVRSFGSSGVSALLAAHAVLWLRRVPLRVTGCNDLVDSTLDRLGWRDRLVVSTRAVQRRR